MPRRSSVVLCCLTSVGLTMAGGTAANSSTTPIASTSSVLRAEWQAFSSTELPWSSLIAPDRPLAGAESSATSSTSGGSTIVDANSGPAVADDDTGQFAMTFDGVNDYLEYRSVGQSPVVDTSRSFSVMARVDPDLAARGTTQTIVAQGGKRTSAYALQLTPDGSYRFSVTSADSGTHTTASAVATRARLTQVCGYGSDPTSPASYDAEGANTVFGVYDRPRGVVEIFVNTCPVPVATTSVPATGVWTATGSLIVGSAWRGGMAQDAQMYGGRLRQLSVWAGALTGDQTAALGQG